MKKLTKLLSAMLVVMMVVSSVASAVTITPGGGAVAFGTTPTMRTNFIGANKASNGLMTETDNATVSAAIGYATDGLVTFTFDEDMDVDTLNSDNIKIVAYSPNNINVAGAAYTKNGLKDARYNTDGSVIYEPLKKSAREFVLWAGDFGARPYRVTFTSNVKTAAGTPITEQKFVFRVGKNAKMPYVEGKRIVQVGFNKPVYDKDGNAVKTSAGGQVTGIPGDYSQPWTGLKIAAGDWWKVDLGNIYEVGGVASYDGMNLADLNTQKTEIYYSSDPNSGFNADQVLPTLWGELDSANKPSGANGSDNASGVNGDRWLAPDEPVYARYIFIKNAGSSSAPVNGLDIFGYADNYYTTITAEKDGAAVTNCTGGGAYTFKASVLDVVGDNDASAYMIAAGYDEFGVITNIKCEPVSYDNGYLSLDAAMPDNTVKVKAALIESFTSPYLLTDALELLPVQ